MATVTGLTAERMLAIEAASVIDGEVLADHLILTKHDGTQIDAGSVVGPQGPQGPTGPAGISGIPGEIKMWANSVLPELATYGKWVWADGAIYDSATYPIAASHIDAAWKTFDGAADPGAGNFRVPDLRGLVPVGLDQMPGGSRKNRVTRAVAITLAAKTGEETHVIAVSEMPSHAHTISGSHYGSASAATQAYDGPNATGRNYPYSTVAYPSTNNIGGGGAHENMQPSVFVPYIVRLDG
jgi:microcystin-dependent protein